MSEVTYSLAYDALTDIENFLSNPHTIDNFVDCQITSKTLYDEGSPYMALDLELELNTDLYDKHGIKNPEKTSMQKTMQKTYFPEFEDVQELDMIYEAWIDAIERETSLEAPIKHDKYCLPADKTGENNTSEALSG